MQNTQQNVRPVALVTGGGRGIGRAICTQLAAQGFDLCINYAGNAATAEETAALCTALGAAAFTVKADVAKAEEVEQLIGATVAQFGHIDVLVNNAGITRDGLLMRMSEQDYDQVLDTNLKGAFLCCKAVCRPMMRQKFGRIINLSSVVGVRGNAGQANYAASKAGLIGLTKSLAKELAGKNITVNAVAPGFIETDMTHAMPEAARQATLASIPMGHTGSAEDVARAVAFFAAKENSYITGQVLCIDGGMAV